MGETVEFPSNGHTCNGYLAASGRGRGAGVVVIQEYWGLVAHIRNVCDRLAAEGFVALAPDLFHGKEAKEPDEAGKLLMELQLDQAGRDMKGAAEWLAASDSTLGRRVGIVGFCMGGALALYAATLSDSIAAVAAFYPYFGVTQAAQPDYTAIKAGVLGHFAEHDGAYTHEQVERLQEQLERAGSAAEFHWYPGEHAFFNDDRQEVHDPEASDLAWRRTLDFLRAHLAASPAEAGSGPSG